MLAASQGAFQFSWLEVRTSRGHFGFMLKRKFSIGPGVDSHGSNSNILIENRSQLEGQLMVLLPLAR